jgi:SAM-dependent methyltransferase
LPREITSDLSMLERLVEPVGKDVVDIGCGSGTLVRDLSERGARVVGIEVSEQQLAPALARARSDGARYLVGSAQALPLDSGSMDIAVFMRTLHHIPPPDMTQALAEARRVLRRTGVVYVAEPLTEGDYFALTNLVEDELEVRAAAREAIDNARQSGLEPATLVEYELHTSLAGVAAYRARTVEVDPDRAPLFDARLDQITEAFKRLGTPGLRPGERRFVQPMRVDVLRPAGPIERFLTC